MGKGIGSIGVHMGEGVDSIGVHMGERVGSGGGWHGVSKGTKRANAKGCIGRGD